MKRAIAFAIMVLTITGVFAQAPSTLNYEFTANNSTGTPVAGRTVGIRASILQGSSSGTAVYIETHNSTTDVNATARITVGGGTVVFGTYGSIDWSSGPYYIKVDIDVSGGSNYNISSTNQFLSVPYALRAKTAESISGNAAGGDLTGSYPNPTVASSAITTAKIANANVTLPKISSSGATTGQAITYDGSSVVWGTPATGGFTHYIGESYGGGVVFHVWKDNAGTEHGLIVGRTNLSSIAWSNITGTEIGATAQYFYDGLTNSNAIVGQASHTSSAAKLCLDATNNSQTDWYLPSIDELTLLRQNRFNVNKTLASISGATQLNASTYWSSTEYNATQAWTFNFVGGSTTGTNKSFVNEVRAIRAF